MCVGAYPETVYVYESLCMNESAVCSVSILGVC